MKHTVEWTVRGVDAIAAVLWGMALTLVVLDMADGAAGVLGLLSGVVTGAAATSTVIAWLSRQLAAIADRMRLQISADQLVMVRPRNGERV